MTSAHLEEIKFFNDGLCRYRVYGYSADIVRPLARIEVGRKGNSPLVYTVISVRGQLDNAGHYDKNSPERVILHTKHLIPAWRGSKDLGAVASVWSKSQGYEGKFMVIGPITRLVFADEDLTFSASSLTEGFEHRH